MHIEHIAIWAEDLDKLCAFYTSYFNLTRSNKYENTDKHFSSYFLSFGEGNSRIELMHISDMVAPANRGKMPGLAHVAISVGSKETVDTLTERLRTDGYTILSNPRTTGDGHYESVIADPEGNYVEITI